MSDARLIPRDEQPGADRGSAHERRSVRDRLLEAATAVIEAVGEENLTLAQVVRRAGLTTGAVYSNFANREELVVAVYLDQYAGRMWEGIEQLEELLASSVRGEAFVEALAEQVIRPGDPTFRTARWLRVRALAAALRYEQVRRAVEDLQQQITSRLVGTIRRAQMRGDIDPSRDPRALALLFQQFGFGLVLHDMSGDEAPDPDAWIELVRDLLLPLFPGRH